MNNFRVGSINRIILLVALLGIAGWAQSRPAVEGQSSEAIRLSTNLVVVDAQVLNRKTGEIVNGLAPADFEIFEDGVRQEITHFSQDKLSLSVILLIDLSGSVSPVLREIREGALEALNRLKENDEVAVIGFSSNTQLVQDFTRDRQLIVDRIARIEKSPVIGQGTSLLQALSDAALHMNRAGNPTSRRVIISLTDNVAWEYNFSGLSEQDVAHQIVDSGSMVCGLIVEGTLSKTEKIFLKNRDGRDIYRRRATVDPFVNQTGGEILKSSKLEITTRLATLIDHLRTRYSLGYSPKRETIDGKYHQVFLQLTDRSRKRLGDLLIRTKQGYFAKK